MKRGEIWLVNLDPTVGREIQKTRPCIILSPDELNDQLGTVIIAPVSSQERGWEFRPVVAASKTKGECLLDQLRSVDKRRFHKRVATLEDDDLEKILGILRDMFA